MTSLTATSRSRRTFSLALPYLGMGALVLAVALTGCAADTAAPPTETATDSTPTDSTPTDSTPTAQTQATTYPLSLTNCGFDVTIPAEPERVVTIKSSTTELMLALGVGDKIVGTAYLDGPLPDSLAAESVPAIDSPLSDKVPGQEAVLGLEPDLIYAGWESNVSADGVGERDALAALGVAAYVSPPACQGEYQPNPLTFDDVFAAITEAGEVFNAADAAAELVESERTALAGIEPDGRGLTALWWSSGTDTPYVGGAIGAPQLIMSAAGLTNIVAEPESWTPFAWEEVAAADPDVIVLVDSEWNSKDKKIDYLESSPVTAKLTAVKEGRYVVVPFASTEAGVRTVEAADSVAAQVKALAVE